MKIAMFSIPALALLASCGGEAPRRVEAAGTVPSTAVRTVDVRSIDWAGSYEATGTVRARTTTTVASKVMAYVQQVNAQTGDTVREGQVLIVLDGRDLETNVRAAEATQAEVRSAIPEADSGVAAAKANLDLAQATFKRMEELASKNSISKQEFDEASAKLRGAEAAYQMARARRAQLDSKMAQAEQGVRSSGIVRDYAKIVAPFSGVVTVRSAEPGTLATPGAPLLTIEREGTYRLEAEVDESRLNSIHAGQAVDVTLDALDRKLSTRVSELGPAVDAASRAYTVKIDLPSIPHLRSGVFGRAAFPGKSRSVLAIPLAALVERGQLQSVFVAEDGVARTRLITVGERRGDTAEVLSGLSAGEKLVAPIPTGLKDGARLEMRP